MTSGGAGRAPSSEKTADPITTPSCSTAMRFPGVWPVNSSTACDIGRLPVGVDVCALSRYLV
ncbi:Uncharacterised protein [Mycobacterium tuberculosis]|uniref:Uncharacterized protein n=2 Tax=Mycobacterium tuberculosis TaxID=1773 RepID=A0A0U0SA08_MYCTX|nr:Uncharacterised protein [Mycobacterium tuberculosis]COW36114.1 Uncharacterised protein [Mycobacterium tuberculosis]COW64968.1 Uncharacterised protein [Mycobacterium tuberculosis]COW69299.1 Uncharacterised protein [Mycobacterium tuberculosis]